MLCSVPSPLCGMETYYALLYRTTPNNCIRSKPTAWDGDRGLKYSSSSKYALFQAHCVGWRRGALWTLLPWMTHFPSPPRGMVTCGRSSNEWVSQGSRPTVWDGDGGNMLILKALLRVLSPLCGMETHTPPRSMRGQDGVPSPPRGMETLSIFWENPENTLPPVLSPPCGMVTDKWRMPS